MGNDDPIPNFTMYCNSMTLVHIFMYPNNPENAVFALINFMFASCEMHSPRDPTNFGYYDARSIIAANPMSMVFTNVQFDFIGGDD